MWLPMGKDLIRHPSMKGTNRLRPQDGSLGSTSEAGGTDDGATLALVASHGGSDGGLSHPTLQRPIYKQ